MKNVYRQIHATSCFRKFLWRPFRLFFSKCCLSTVMASRWERAGVKRWDNIDNTKCLCLKLVLKLPSGMNIHIVIYVDISTYMHFYEHQQFWLGKIVAHTLSERRNSCDTWAAWEKLRRYMCICMWHAQTKQKYYATFMEKWNFHVVCSKNLRSLTPAVFSALRHKLQYKKTVRYFSHLRLNVCI